MIGIKGQYICKFDIGDKKDFITENDLIRFTLIEDAGNVLPTFELSFLTASDDILYYLQENNTIFVSFGKDELDSTTFLTVTKVDSSKQGVDRRIIVLFGVYNLLQYMGNTYVYISDKKSGVEVIKEIAGKYFGNNNIISNIDKSYDSQRWIQYNITDRAFINQIWLHSYIPDSFISLGITSDGKFIIKDIRKALKNGYDWRFIDTATNNNDIITNGDSIFTFQSGLINSWVGYGREKYIYDLEGSTISSTFERAEPLLSNSEHLIKNGDIKRRYSSIGVINRNTHRNYWKAYQRNLTNLAEFSTLRVTLSYSNVYVPMKVLDIAQLNEEMTENINESSEYQSGLYIITKVSRSISGKILCTTVQMCREAPNRVKDV